MSWFSLLLPQVYWYPGFGPGIADDPHTSENVNGILGLACPDQSMRHYVIVVSRTLMSALKLRRTSGRPSNGTLGASTNPLRDPPPGPYLMRCNFHHPEFPRYVEMSENYGIFTLTCRRPRGKVKNHPPLNFVHPLSLTLRINSKIKKNLPLSKLFWLSKSGPSGDGAPLSSWR